MSNIQDKLIAGGLEEVRKKAQKGEKIQGMDYGTAYKLLTGKDASKKYKGPLPKSKPNKLERLLNKRVKGEKGPYKPKIGDLNEMGPIVTDTKTGEIVSGFKDGGAVRGMGAAYQGKSRTCKVR